MAKALPAGRVTRRRALFGFFDADGWGWATTKAFFWLLVIIMTLGYIPDRAYYFVVSRTIDLGILGWAPVNLCPPENTSQMPCPVPAGSVLPWQATAADAALPQPRRGGVAFQLGTNLLYVGGSDGSAATTTSFVTKVDRGSFGAWSEGPALPEARTDAAFASLSGTAYLIGGTGPDGAPTDTVWALGLNPDTSELTTWTPDQAVTPPVPLPTLPAPRSGASAVAVSDGIVVAGGRGPDGQPTTTVWKATVNDKGVLGDFVEQPALLHAVADAAAAFEGTFVWVYGGDDAAGATAAVQRAEYGPAPAPGTSGAPAASGPVPTAAAEATPSPSGAEVVIRWAVVDAASLPGPRGAGAGFAANGALYFVGGSEGNTTHRELYWALPDSTGALPGGWRHLDQIDLPSGLADAAPVVSGSTVILIGGTADGPPLATSVKSSLAPQEPFFRLGLVGVVVPGLQIGGEIGQQLGYLAAAGVGTGNFVLLIVVAWAFNHRTQIAEWRERRRLAREAKPPKEEG